MASRRRRRVNCTLSESDFSEDESYKPERTFTRDSECESEIGTHEDLSEYESATEERDDDFEEDGDSVLIESEYDEGPRQSGDGQEQEQTDENLDDDQDRKNPAYVPRRGAFYEHDMRKGEDGAKEETDQDKQKKLWKDDIKWRHDKYDPNQQAPKSRDEIVAMYGHDIRQRDRPPDPSASKFKRGGRRGRRNRYQLREYITNAVPDRIDENLEYNVDYNSQGFRGNASGGGRFRGRPRGPRSGSYSQFRGRYNNNNMGQQQPKRGDYGPNDRYRGADRGYVESRRPTSRRGEAEGEGFEERARTRAGPHGPTNRFPKREAAGDVMVNKDEQPQHVPPRAIRGRDVTHHQRERPQQPAKRHRAPQSVKNQEELDARLAQLMLEDEQVEDGATEQPDAEEAVDQVQPQQQPPPRTEPRPAGKRYSSLRQRTADPTPPMDSAPSQPSDGVTPRQYHNKTSGFPTQPQSPQTQAAAVINVPTGPTSPPQPQVTSSPHHVGTPPGHHNMQHPPPQTVVYQMQVPTGAVTAGAAPVIPPLYMSTVPPGLAVPPPAHFSNPQQQVPLPFQSGDAVAAPPVQMLATPTPRPIVGVPPGLAPPGAPPGPPQPVPSRQPSEPAIQVRGGTTYFGPEVQSSMSQPGQPSAGQPAAPPVHRHGGVVYFSPELQSSSGRDGGALSRREKQVLQIVDPQHSSETGEDIAKLEIYAEEDNYEEDEEQDEVAEDEEDTTSAKEEAMVVPQSSSQVETISDVINDPSDHAAEESHNASDIEETPEDTGVQALCNDNIEQNDLQQNDLQQKDLQHNDDAANLSNSSNESASFASADEIVDDVDSSSKEVSDVIEEKADDELSEKDISREKSEPSDDVIDKEQVDDVTVKATSVVEEIGDDTLSSMETIIKDTIGSDKNVPDATTDVAQENSGTPV